MKGQKQTVLFVRYWTVCSKCPYDYSRSSHHQDSKSYLCCFFTITKSKKLWTITVQEIIDIADVGRSTFYSHYESKELLLDELCRYLFHHLFEREENISTEAYLSHIFSHFKKNQDHITSLLFSKNDYFLRQLQKELEHHVYPMVAKDLQVFLS